MVLNLSGNWPNMNRLLLLIANTDLVSMEKELL
jgi:hypothetical protein